MHIHLGQDLGRFRKPASQLIKYAHIDPITDFCILVIPETIFQTSAFKFGSVGALNMLNTLINRNHGFCDNPKSNFADYLTRFLVVNSRYLRSRKPGITYTCNNWDHRHINVTPQDNDVITHLPCGGTAVIKLVWGIYRMSWIQVLPLKLPSGEFRKAWLIIRQYWFRLWLFVVLQKKPYLNQC